MRRSSRAKHGFIQFYMDDWKAGTAHMARVVRSVYFDLCLYTWDKRQPVSVATRNLMFADLGPQADAIVDALVDEGALIQDTKGAVHSPRALAEAERAFAAWEAKSRGGRVARGVEDSSKSDARVLQDSPTEQDQELEQEQEPESKGDDVPISPESVEKSVKKANERHTIVETWNEIAAANGLPQVMRMTDKRISHLDARLKEVGFDDLLIALKMVPTSRFLIGHGPEGWKAHFDWFLQPSSFVKLQEGFYHNDRKKKGASAWTQ